MAFMDKAPLLDQPSHGKLKLANSCWQTQVGVCEQHKKQLAYVLAKYCRQKELAPILTNFFMCQLVNSYLTRE